MREARPYRRQWRQLMVLTAAHFVLDMYPGMMHTVLPALQESFGLSVAAGAALLTFFLIASNAIQVLVGHLRPARERPLFLYAGVVLTLSILLFGAVRAGPGALIWLSLIALVSGTGVGIAHPEGLRAVHRLEGISAAVSSSVFMGGGVFGFAFGGLASTYLYSRYEALGLVPMCVLSAAVLAVMLLAGVKLAVEPPQASKSEINSNLQKFEIQETSHVPFWVIFGMAALTGSSVQVLLWIVPQHVSQMGAELTQGGRTVSLFTVAGGIGGMCWARFAARRGELKTIILMLAVGVTLVGLYLAVMERGAVATAALAASGFFCFGSYPIMVSLARKSGGSGLGRRMGLIVGGIWLVACVLPMLLGPLAQRWGTAWILYSVPGGFAGALLLAVIARSRTSRC